jgi:phytoene dehydrogenase-like protein
MADGPRVVVIGGGVEGLTAAACLARRGCRVTLLERRATTGGRHGEVAIDSAGPVPLLFDDVPPPLPAVDAALQLARHGLGVRTARRVLATVTVDGSVAWIDSAGAASTGGASAAALQKQVARLASALDPLLHRVPPCPDGRTAADIWTAVLAAREYVRLTRPEIVSLLRRPPMPVADLVEESFEDEAVAALVATRGLGGVFGGPKSAGTAAVLLLRAAAEGGLLGPARVVDGGAPALVRALEAGARSAGVEIRTSTAVAGTAVDRGRVSGVVLEDGSVLRAGAVVSGLDPRATLLDLVDPALLDARIAWRVARVRARGTTSRVFLALDRLPPFDGKADWPDRLVLPGSVADLERAFDAIKYGGWADDCAVEVAVHRQGPSPVLACTLPLTPPAPRDSSWREKGHALAGAVVRTLDARVPGLAAAVTTAVVQTPEDLRQQVGSSHPYHVELALDQLWLARPALGLGAYRTPLGGLYLCGPCTHPGIARPGTCGWLASTQVLRDLAHETG